MRRQRGQQRRVGLESADGGGGKERNKGQWRDRTGGKPDNERKRKRISGKKRSRCEKEKIRDQ